MAQREHSSIDVQCGIAPLEAPLQEFKAKDVKDLGGGGAAASPVGPGQRGRS